MIHLSINTGANIDLAEGTKLKTVSLNKRSPCGKNPTSEGRLKGRKGARNAGETLLKDSAARSITDGDVKR